MSAPRRIAVVGAGLAGLAAAHAIRRRAAERGLPLDLEVLEAAERAGGQLDTVLDDGFLVEWAANAFRAGIGPARDLVARAGLAGERVEAGALARRRYVFHGGALHLLPGGPASLLGFRPMSPVARWRVLAEPFVAGRVGVEESVHDFAARHLGREAADVLIGTMVRGVYGGDARRLSVDAAFPVMREMERAHRSLVVASLLGAPARRREGRSTWTLARGMGSLTTRLADDLGEALRTGARVEEIALDTDAGRPRLGLASGERRQYDAVALAVPSGAAARLADGIDAGAGAEIAAIPTAPIGMVALAFEREAFRTAPDGYGFLVAPGEEVRALGALVESNVFPGRAPAGTVLVRVVVGGVDQGDLGARSDDEVAASALEALDRAWGISRDPIRTWVGRQADGIPQYVLGHQARVARVARRLRSAGVHLAGNAYRGVAVGRLVEAAELIADDVLDDVAALPPRRAG